MQIKTYDRWLVRVFRDGFFRELPVFGVGASETEASINFGQEKCSFVNGVLDLLCVSSGLLVVSSGGGAGTSFSCDIKSSSRGI